MEDLLPTVIWGHFTPSTSKVCLVVLGVCVVDKNYETYVSILEFYSLR